MAGNKIFIGIFGKRNQGKSALINAIAGQEIAIVSDTPGTTTDPVKKSIEIFGIGPCVLIDTAGLDDTGEVGEKRVEKSLEALKIIDAALLLISHNEWDDTEKEIIRQFKEFDVPFVIVHNKSDIQSLQESTKTALEIHGMPIIDCSARQKQDIDKVVKELARIIPTSAYHKEILLDDIIHEGENIVLVMPQDSEAPEGRLILPQVQVIRNILDNHASATCLQPQELAGYLQKNRPDLIVTDSQVFAAVEAIVPPKIPLTGFSIVLARSKGNFDDYLQGTPHIKQLQDGDTVLIMESCTHISSCEDIGRQKLPKLLQKYTGKQLKFEFVSALSPLPDLNNIKMAIQCGGCMVTKKQLSNRIKEIKKHHIPVSNYGMAIAYCTKIYYRATEIFKQ